MKVISSTRGTRRTRSLRGALECSQPAWLNVNAPRSALCTQLENTLLMQGPVPQLKICDFGFSKAEDIQSETTTMVRPRRKCHISSVVTPLGATMGVGRRCLS